MIGVRRALNWESRLTTVYASASGAYTTAWTSDPIPTDRAWDVQIDATASSTSGATQAAAYTVRSLFLNDAGTVSQAAATSSLYAQSTSASIGCALTYSGQTVIFRVKDDGVSPMTWKITVTVRFTDEQ